MSHNYILLIFTPINLDLVIRKQNIICYEKFYDFYSIINNVIYN